MVLKGSELAHTGSNGTAHLWHTCAGIGTTIREFHHEMSPKAISQSQRPGLRTTRELASVLATVTFKLSTSDSWGNSMLWQS